MLPIRVYYEDTDCGGVVYYANYLRYFERGRTEFLREKGVSIPECKGKGVLFVVRRAEIEYLSPAHYNDLLLLETNLTEVTGATLTFRHSVTRQGSGVELARGTVVLAAVNDNGRPVRIPGPIKTALT